MLSLRFSHILIVRHMIMFSLHFSLIAVHVMCLLNVCLSHTDTASRVSSLHFPLIRVTCLLTTLPSHTRHVSSHYTSLSYISRVSSLHVTCLLTTLLPLSYTRHVCPNYTILSYTSHDSSLHFSLLAIHVTCLLTTLLSLSCSVSSLHFPLIHVTCLLTTLLSLSYTRHEPPHYIFLL